MFLVSSQCFLETHDNDTHDHLVFFFFFFVEFKHFKFLSKILRKQFQKTKTKEKVGRLLAVAVKGTGDQIFGAGDQLMAFLMC